MCGSLVGNIEEEVLKKYNVEVSKRGAYKRSSRSRGWSIESRNINLENGVKTAGRESQRGPGNTICNESKSMQESHMEKKERKQQQRMNTMTDMTRNIKAKGRMDANSQFVDL